MKLTLVLIALAACAVAYGVWVRPYLKSLPSMSAVWEQEATTWGAIKAWLDGRKTILIGMWGEAIAFAPDLLQIISGADLKTALSLPDNWAALVNIAVPVLMMIFRTKAA